MKRKRVSSSSRASRSEGELSSSESDSDDELQVLRRELEEVKKQKALVEKERDYAFTMLNKADSSMHHLKEEHRSCASVRENIQERMKEAIENVIKRADERVEQAMKLRNDAMQEAEDLKHDADATKKAAAEAVRLTSQFHVWRIRSLVARKKKAKDSVVSTAEADVSKETTTSQQNPFAQVAPGAKRSRLEVGKPAVEDFKLKLISVLSGNYNKATAFKYYLFVKENFCGKVKLEEVTEFLRTQSKEHALVADRISELGAMCKLI